ncbi:MAG TPA: FadD3 family acyl-CoA ligase [Acidimicrobiales bacterium]|nr:FadD3 family acyl-CoA ligase [Acidimicrobiales bacterium]
MVSILIDPRGDLQWETIPGLVEDAAARFGETEALVDHHGPDGTTIRLTFDQLAEDVAAATRALIANGIERGDRVAIWAPNSAAWVVAALGAVGAGAVLVPLNTRFKGAEAAYVLRSAGARILFTVQGFLGVDYPALLAAAVADGNELPDLERVVLLQGGDSRQGGDGLQGGDGAESTRRRQGDPVIAWPDFLQEGTTVGEDVAAGRTASISSGDPCDLIYTSGTTGRPKGVLNTHGQTLRTFATWAEVTGLDKGDRYLVVNPFFHTFGYKAGVLVCLMRGATIVAEPVFDVEAVRARIAEEHISVLAGPPTIYQSILSHPDAAGLTSLRLAVTGAAVIPVDLVHQMQSELGMETVLTGYGLTEATGVVTMCRRGDSAETIALTSGRAIPDVEVQIVDADNHEVPQGEAGEILVRGYTLMSGYWNAPAGADEVIDADGWLHTGDVGTMDENGNIAITDRLKDMYVCGGFNAYPAEIEAVLRDHPGVDQVAVIGIPDDRMGEVGCAYVVVADGSTADDVAAGLADWSRERLANYKVPRVVKVVDALPVSAAGKVLKRELRRQFAAG